MKRARDRVPQRAGAAALNRALRSRPGGAHAKTRKALRRAERMATRRLGGGETED